MFVYEKKLQYPVKITNPNPKYAQIIISQYGGPDGELGASLRYLSQRFSFYIVEHHHHSVIGCLHLVVLHDIRMVQRRAYHKLFCEKRYVSGIMCQFRLETFDELQSVMDFQLIA